MTWSRILRRALSLGALLPLGACYTARPLDTPVPPPATRIIATLTDSGTVVMGNAIGSGAVAIEGVVSAADAGAWQLQLLRVDHRDGRSVEWSRETVSFPRSVLTGLEQKSIDRTRSWILAGAIAAGSYLATRAFGLTGGGGEEGGEPIPTASVVRR